MRIIPVIDLLGGRVVRGIAGRRQEYRPIESLLGCEATPSSVAQAFVNLGLREAYVADLDAIAGAQPAWTAYEEIAQAGLQLWVDAGMSDGARAQQLAEFRAAKGMFAGVIAGLESLPAPAILAELLAVVGSERLVFSLDLHAGAPRTTAAAWQGLGPLEIMRSALDLGVRRAIVLDLARVGVGQGVGTEDLCRQFRAWDASLEITAGGGVRSLHDLESLAAVGCNAVLVASALHDRRLTENDLHRFRE